MHTIKALICQLLIDLLVLKQNTGDLFPVDADNKCMFKKVDHLETWKAMEKCVELGLVRSIGLSNFNSKQTQHVLDGCKIKPAVNQVIGYCFYTISLL